jgi:hypothetical protein
VANVLVVGVHDQLTQLEMVLCYLRVEGILVGTPPHKTTSSPGLIRSPACKGDTSLTRRSGVLETGNDTWDIQPDAQTVEPLPFAGEGPQL